ncbi:MAG: 5-carboxymethyl-2-hydroxymuconate Delta-isomerase [Proteobacteria bacterium]|nr:5-carboxymethyl-2-hydroxymuconate Delta-isomerase [Pseudomonadota bacterium]
MPHQTIEYSANLEPELDIEALVRVLHETAASIDALPIGGLRTRAVARQHYRIADGHPDNAFINVFLRIAPGRSFEVRKAAGEKLFQALCEYLEPIYSSSPLAISYEIQELDADLRWKKNNLREYLAAREKEK